MGETTLGSRTRDLPPLGGVAGFLRELRYSEVGRQAVGLLLMPLLAMLGDAEPRSFLPGLLLALAGLLVRLYASGYIRKNEALATTGPYSVVRHPLYLGNLLLLAGFTVMADRWWALPLAAGFWFFYYPPAIEYEDRKLRRIFGAACEQWQRRTPAVLPCRLRPAAGDGHWCLRTSMKRNVEALVLGWSTVWLLWLSTSL